MFAAIADERVWQADYSGCSCSRTSVPSSAVGNPPDRLMSGRVMLRWY